MFMKVGKNHLFYAGKKKQTTKACKVH